MRQVEIKKIKRKITINTYLITFEYETYRGYRREQQRTIRDFSEEEARAHFYMWGKEQRTMTNVKILGIEELEEQREEFDL